MANKDSKSTFFCSNCGNEYSTWSGRCLACGEWNSLKEVSAEKVAASSGIGQKIAPQKLSGLKKTNPPRISSGYKEVDRVFGGGIVNGSVILLGGEPGIGKSTLLLQIIGKFGPTLYVSGEESAEQIKLRADRLKVKIGNISVSSTPDISGLEEEIIESSPKLVVID